MIAIDRIHPGLVAFVSLAALTAVGCSAGWEPDAVADTGLEAQAGPPQGHPAHPCRRHIGVNEEWLSVAPLPRARTRHNATLLPDGQVLVAGGFGTWPYPRTVETYNPATDTWTTGGELFASATVLRSVLLQDGRVFYSPGQVVYDPSSGTSTEVPLTPRESAFGYPFDHSMLTALPSGLVLRTGGSDDDRSINEAALYNPATNTWASAANMSVTRFLHSSTLLQDGRVLVVGGSSMTGNERPEGRTSVEIYDPATNTWAAGAPTNMPRMWHSATLLPSGQVLVIGGGGRVYSGPWEEDDVIAYADNTAEIYDPATGTWTPTTPPSFWYNPSHAATVMSQGRVMVVGPYGAEIYKPADDTWTVVDEPTLRTWHTATTLQDGSVLITGGNERAFKNPGPLTSVERYGNGCPRP